MHVTKQLIMHGRSDEEMRKQEGGMEEEEEEEGEAGMRLEKKKVRKACKKLLGIKGEKGSSCGIVADWGPPQGLIS